MNVACPKTRQKVWRVVFALLALCAAAFAFYRVYGNSVDAPFWDEWDLAPIIFSLDHNSLRVSDLWTQHNEHRIFFPQLLILGLQSLGWWSQRRECLFGLCIVTGSLWAVWRLLRETVSLSAAYVLVAVDSMLLFSPAQVQNWLWGFQIAWYLVDLCCFLAILAIGRKVTFATLAMALVCATIGSYSLAFGLAILPALLAVMLIRRGDVSRPLYATWAISTLAIVVVYFAGWHGSDASPTVSIGLLRSAGAITQTVLQVLGENFGTGQLFASALAGSLGLALGLATCTAVALCPDAEVRRRGAPWVGVVAYGVTSSIMIGAGRSHLGIGASLQSRYFTCSLTYWIGVFSVLEVCRERWADWFSRPATLAVQGIAAFAAGASLFATWISFSHVFATTRNTYEVLRSRIGTYAILSNAELRAFYPSPSRVRIDMALMATDAKLPEQLTSPMPTEGTRGLEAVSSIDRVERMADGKGLVISGWAIDPWSLFGQDQILVSTTGGVTIETVAVTRSGRPDIGELYGVRGLSDKGYSVQVYFNRLSAGTHQINLALASLRGVKLAFPQAVTFTVDHAVVASAAVVGADEP